MQLLVLAALVVVAAADRLGSAGQSGTAVYRYGTSSGTQSRYTAAGSSSGYELKSRRKPFEPTLKPLNGGYSRQNGDANNINGRYSSQSNGGYYSQSNGDFTAESNGGYNSQSNGRYNTQSNGGHNAQSNGLYNSQSNGGYNTQSNGGYSTESTQSSGASARQSASTRYTPRYSGSFSQRSSRAGFGRPEPTPAPQPYSFSYDVLDVLGNDYGAAEASNGEQVQGQYSVLLPDGRLQTVSYSVEGDSGFVADVQYEGEARFPDRDGAERGRSSVTRGAGPDAQYGYGRK